MFMLIILGVVTVILWLRVFLCCNNIAFADDISDLLMAVYCSFILVTILALRSDFSSNNSDCMKEEYKTIVYAMETCDKHGAPYSMELIERITEWNKKYKRYVSFGAFDLFDIYPESAIEGTSEIILEIQK